MTHISNHLNGQCSPETLWWWLGSLRYSGCLFLPPPPGISVPASTALATTLMHENTCLTRSTNYTWTNLDLATNASCISAYRQKKKPPFFFPTRKRDQRGEHESFILLMRFCEGCDSLILTYMCRIHLAEFLATACMLSLSANRLSHYDRHRADGYAQTHTHARTHTHTRTRTHM